MVLGFKAARLLTYEPEPEPSIVLLSEIVGVPVVFHTTPLAVIIELPKAVIFPPLLAPVGEI